MKGIRLAFLFLFFPIVFMAQSFELLTPLPFEVTETSGVICLNNRLITHNDSANEPMLFEIDSVTGNVLRTVTVTNVPNIDWEDIAFDDTYIYIGDFGNQAGNRTNLRVLQILRSDYFEIENDDVSAEIIAFNYADQTDFTTAQFATKYDAEALISYGDSLYIFTKDWLNYNTTIYALAKNPGNYTIYKRDSIAFTALVTGADINESTGELMLSCYNIPVPFALLVSNFSGTAFSQGTIESIPLPIPAGYSFQLEAVCRAGSGVYYFTAEGGAFGNAGLYKLNLNPNLISERQQSQFLIYPNPTSDFVIISTANAVNVFIYSMHGKLVKTATSNTISVSDLPKGIYFIDIRGSADQMLGIQKLIVQ